MPWGGPPGCHWHRKYIVRRDGEEDGAQVPGENSACQNALLLFLHSSFLLRRPVPPFYLTTIKIQTQETCSEKNLHTKKKPQNPPSQVHNESCKTSSAWKILPVSFSYCLIPALSYTE